MKHTTLLAALAFAAFAAHAAEAQPAAAAPKEAAGVKLSKICDACGVVTRVRQETRKGEASGMGAVGGAVAGGMVGNKTTDNTIGTVGGAAVGGLLGNAIEKKLKKRKVYATSVTLKDGTVKKFDTEADPAWKAGTLVEVGADGALKEAPLKR
jgi:outer membrane lipoprotein SlyB